MCNPEPTSFALTEAIRSFEQAQYALWNLKHTADLQAKDNESVGHIISGLDAMTRQLGAYQEQIASLSGRSGAL